MTNTGNDDDTCYVKADHDGDDGDDEHDEDDGDGDDDDDDGDMMGGV